MPADRPYSVSVAGVAVDDDGRVLVIRRRDNGRWEAPGGILEVGETIPDGVVREILEETGVTVAVERLTGVYQNMTRNVVALVYRCRPLERTPHETQEALTARWVHLDEVEQLMAPAYAVRVRDAFLPEPATRPHDGRDLL